MVKTRYDILSGRLIALAGSPEGGGGTSPVLSAVDPTAADNGYPVGQLWINTTTRSAFILVDLTGGNASWSEISSAITPLPRVAIDIVDASQPPPTTVNGDTYVIDDKTPIDAGWGVGAQNNDILLYDGAQWNRVVPIDGTIITFKTPNTVYLFENNAWHSITEYLKYDNSLSQLVSTNVQSAITELKSSLFAYEAITGASQTLEPNKGYILLNVNLVSLTLPTNIKAGQKIDIIDDGLGGWELLQNAGQSVHLNGFSSTVGITGKAASTAPWNTATIICRVEDQEFLIVRPQGTIELT